MSTFIIISPGFPGDEQDTACLPPIQHFVLCCKRLHPDLEIVVVALQYPFRQATYNWHGVKVISIGGSNKGGVRRLITWTRVYRQLQKVKTENCIGILSLWLHECALIGKWFASANKSKHFTWMQGQDARANNSYVKRIKPNPDQLIAISKFNCEELERHHGIKPAHIIENGIDPENFPILNTIKRPIDIIGVGSLIPLKRFGLFICVVKELLSEFPDLRCVIIGDGDEKQNLADLIKNAGISQNIELKGNLPHAKVLTLMNESRILFHTSEYEGNSTVILEALFSGCQVVSALDTNFKKDQNFHHCETPEEMKVQLKKLLSEDQIAERRKVNTMQESARKILSLFGVH